jgi:hypothetical protein
VSRGLPLIVAAIAACLASIGLLALDGPGPARLVAVLAMFCLAPGAGLLPLLEPGRRPPPGLVVGTSLAVDTVLAQLMLATRTFDPPLATYLLAGCCLPVLALNLVRSARPAEALRGPAPGVSALRSALRGRVAEHPGGRPRARAVPDGPRPNDLGTPPYGAHDGHAGADSRPATVGAPVRPMPPRQERTAP